jgi:hypothetical protein
MTFNVLRGSVGPQGNAADGANPLLRLGKSGEPIFSELHGKYAEEASRGNLFMAVAPLAGITIPIYSNTAQVFALWNQSATKYLELVELTINHIGTPLVSGNIGFGVINAGLTIATGNISAITKGTAFNMKTLTAQEANAGKYCSAATVVAVAATSYIPIGVTSPGVYAAAATTNPWQVSKCAFDGQWMIAPGMCVVLCGNVAQTQASGVTLSWIERDPV